MKPVICDNLYAFISAQLFKDLHTAIFPLKLKPIGRSVDRFPIYASSHYLKFKKKYNLLLFCRHSIYLQCLPLLDRRYFIKWSINNVEKNTCSHMELYWCNSLYMFKRPKFMDYKVVAGSLHIIKFLFQGKMSVYSENC